MLRLSRLFYLAQPLEADTDSAEPVDKSLAILIDVRTAAPRLLGVLPSPSRETERRVIA